MKNILVFGDSHLAGSELHDTIKDESDKNKTWPAIVGRHFNIPVKNFALPGGSNDRSFRLLPEILLTYKESFVIYGITEWTRSEIFYKNLKYIPVGQCWTYKQKDELNEPQKSFNKLYMDNFVEYTLSEINDNNYKILNHLLHVQNICKLYAYDYLIVPLRSLPILNKKQKTINDAIDKNKIFNFNDEIKLNSWVDWCRKNNFPKGISHYLEPAHDAFANIMIERFNQLYDLN